MDFQFFILLLATLACPIGMGAMMWWMHKSMNHPSISEKRRSLSQSKELADSIFERNQALEARIAELERRFVTNQEELS